MSDDHHHFVDWSGDFSYHVERWSDDDQRIERVFALCAEAEIAHAAFDVMVKKYPHKRWLIRIKTMIVKRYVPHGMNDADQS